MYANATLELDTAKDIVVAPMQAVDRSSDGARVMVVSGDGTTPGRVEERAVALGLEADDRIEVTRGLNQGDLVVIGSRAQLKQGMTVAPKLATAAAGSER
jgi:multidrug efflux system membrane fusion protein